MTKRGKDLYLRAMDAVALFIGGLVVGVVSGVSLVRYGMGLGFRIEKDIRNDLAPLEDVDDYGLDQTHTSGENLDDE